MSGRTPRADLAFYVGNTDNLYTADPSIADLEELLVVNGPCIVTLVITSSGGFQDNGGGTGEPRVVCTEGDSKRDGGLTFTLGPDGWQFVERIAVRGRLSVRYECDNPIISAGAISASALRIAD